MKLSLFCRHYEWIYNKKDSQANCMKTFIVVIFAFAFLASTAYAQHTKKPAIESGSIISSKTGAPVEGATIIFFPGKQTIISDEQGRFSIARNHANTDSIVISAIGHERSSINYADFAKQKGVVALNEQVIELNSVTIALNPGEQDRKSVV